MRWLQLGFDLISRSLDRSSKVIKVTVM